MQSFLPNLTLGYRVHAAAGRALKVRGKLAAVGKRAADAEHARRVGPGLDSILEVLGPVLGAPGVGRADPEHLEERKKIIVKIIIDLYTIVFKEIGRPHDGKHAMITSATHRPLVTK